MTYMRYSAIIMMVAALASIAVLIKQGSWTLPDLLFPAAVVVWAGLIASGASPEGR